MLIAVLCCSYSFSSFLILQYCKRGSADAAASDVCDFISCLCCFVFLQWAFPQCTAVVPSLRCLCMRLVSVVVLLVILPWLLFLLFLLVLPLRAMRLMCSAFLSLLVVIVLARISPHVCTPAYDDVGCGSSPFYCFYWRSAALLLVLILLMVAIEKIFVQRRVRTIVVAKAMWVIQVSGACVMPLPYGYWLLLEAKIHWM